MNTRYYIAYGSNLNKAQMRWRCPDAKVIGTAELKDWKLLFKGSKSGAYLTIEKEDGGTVPAAVWSVSERDEQMLDRYEGYPTFYYKMELPVTVKDIKKGKLRHLTAFVYVMHEDRPEGIPSKQYIQVCAEGYRDFGFDLNILADAVWNIKEDGNENE